VVVIVVEVVRRTGARTLIPVGKRKPSTRWTVSRARRGGRAL